MKYRIWETNYYLWVGDFVSAAEGPTLPDLLAFVASKPKAPPITGIVKREYDVEGVDLPVKPELHPIATYVEWEVLTTDRRVCAVIGRI